MLDLNELRQLTAASTPGEWERVAAGGDTLLVVKGRGGIGRLFDKVPDNGAFITAAHNAMPALLDELEALRKEAAEHEYYLDRLTEHITKYLGKKPYSLPEGIDGLGRRIAELEGKLELATLALAKREPEPQTVTIGGSSEC